MLLVGFLGCGCSQPPSPESFTRLTWKQLRFGVADNPSVGKVVFPEAVRQLDRLPVRLEGFMVPVEADEDGVKSFVLVRDQQMCCFGRMPALDEWVMVEMGSGGTEMNLDEPLVVMGTLAVGEKVEEGVVTCLYRITSPYVQKLERKPEGWKASWRFDSRVSTRPFELCGDPCRLFAVWTSRFARVKFSAISELTGPASPPVSRSCWA